MTSIIDRVLVRMGLTCEELRAVRGRQILYLGLTAMAITGLMLASAIVTNLV